MPITAAVTIAARSGYTEASGDRGGALEASGGMVSMDVDTALGVVPDTTGLWPSPDT